MRQFQIVTSSARILSPRPQQCDLGGSVFWQGDDRVALRTWSQRCHSHFTKLVFKACAGTLIAQVPEAASPQHQLVLAGRSWPDFGCQRGWGCCPAPWVCRGKENRIRTCPSFGDGQSSLMCSSRGLSCAPQFVECIHLILVRGSLHHSVLCGGVCLASQLDHAWQVQLRGATCQAPSHLPQPLEQSHPVPGFSHVALHDTPRRFTLQKSKQSGKVSINIYFLQSIILPLPACYCTKPLNPLHEGNVPFVEHRIMGPLMPPLPTTALLQERH